MTEFKVGDKVVLTDKAKEKWKKLFEINGEASYAQNIKGLVEGHSFEVVTKVEPGGVWLTNYWLLSEDLCLYEEGYVASFSEARKEYEPFGMQAPLELYGSDLRINDVPIAEYLPPCCPEDGGIWNVYEQPMEWKEAEKAPEFTGSSVSYYSVQVENPTTKGKEPYEAECNDIIEALNMNFAEGNAFKALWRRAAARTLDKVKKGYDNGLYDAEKVVFFGGRIVEQSKQKEKQ